MRYQHLLLWSETFSNYWFLKYFLLDLSSLLLYLIYSPHFLSRFISWFSSFEKPQTSNVCWASPIQVLLFQVLFLASLHLNSCFSDLISVFLTTALPSLPPSCYKPSVSHQVTFFSVCLLVLLEFPAVVVITDNTTLETSKPPTILMFS